jgi:hypothetical protein
MDKQRQRMFQGDYLNVVFWIALMWIVLSFVYLESAAAFNFSKLARDIALGIGSIVAVFATASLTAVLVHLRKNRDLLYAEDLANLQLMKACQKEGE